ncbi:MAG: hypothetical protein H6923_01185 [Alphaproteobacteria bacterium]|nr:hypothetical protein [Alphaproteobacteria bacterium]
MKLTEFTRGLTERLDRRVDERVDKRLSARLRAMEDRLAALDGQVAELIEVAAITPRETASGGGR